MNCSESYDFSSKSYIFGVKSSGLELLKIMNSGHVNSEWKDNFKDDLADLKIQSMKLNYKNENTNFYFCLPEAQILNNNLHDERYYKNIFFHRYSNFMHNLVKLISRPKPIFILD